MRQIRKMYDVVAWGLCVGCGACFYMCDKHAVSLLNRTSTGILPSFKKSICDSCNSCLSICPGIQVDAAAQYAIGLDGCYDALLIGPTMMIAEGYASDPQIRFKGSSGGLLSALSLYCIEREEMDFVLHTGGDSEAPWLNRTVQSRSREELLSRCGSRYAPSSPCDSLDLIERNDKPTVFIGKPCDAAAIAKLRERRPQLDANLGLVLSFFCAGTPSTQGTLELLDKMGIDQHAVHDIHYRGNGWPGDFRVNHHQSLEDRLSYTESWSFLEKYRCFRCHLCPDGLGEIADISCGDAWHRHIGGDSPGLSLALVRSKRGLEILNRAKAAGYIELTPSTAAQVIAAQGLAERRKAIFGRLLAMKLLLVPTPCFPGFPLYKAWTSSPMTERFRSILGTFKRVLYRGLWRRAPL